MAIHYPVSSIKIVSPTADGPMTPKSTTENEDGPPMDGAEAFAWVYWFAGLLGLSVVVVAVFGQDGPDTSPTFLKRTGFTWLFLITLYSGARLL